MPYFVFYVKMVPAVQGLLTARLSVDRKCSAATIPGRYTACGEYCFSVTYSKYLCNFLSAWCYAEQADF